MKHEVEKHLCYVVTENKKWWEYFTDNDFESVSRRLHFYILRCKLDTKRYFYWAKYNYFKD